MKVTINGSPNKNGNTYHAIRMVADAGKEASPRKSSMSATESCAGLSGLTPNASKKKNEQCIQARIRSAGGSRK